MTAKLVSVIGPVASGKTLLAEKLSAELPAELIREDYAGNPFLAASYTGSSEARLPSQLYFLMSRVKQLLAASWPDSGLFVSDYGYCQDRIFASQRLTDGDFEVYQRVALSMSGLVQSPDLVICLDASVDTLTERIAGRGREYEKSFTKEFLTAMRSEYSNVTEWANAPVISVDTDAVDLRDDKQLAKVISSLREKL